METHELFIQAVMERRIIRALIDQGKEGTVEKVLVPVDFAPHRKYSNSGFTYQFCDPEKDCKSSLLSISPEALLDLALLGEMFAPADFSDWESAWNIPRTGKLQRSRALTETH